MTVNALSCPHFSISAATLGSNPHILDSLPSNAPLIRTVSIVGASLVAAPARWRQKGVNKLLLPQACALKSALFMAVDLGFRLHKEIFALIYNYHKYGNDFCSTAVKSDMVVVYRVRQGADREQSLVSWRGALEIADPFIFTSFSLTDQRIGVFRELRAHDFVNGVFKHGGARQERIEVLRASSHDPCAGKIILHSQTIVRGSVASQLTSFETFAPSA